MNRFLVIPNHTREKTKELLSRSEEILTGLGADYDISPGGEADPEKSYDAVIFIGGDGTMLRSAHTALRLDVPMVGINAGSLGYYSRIKEDELEEKLPRLVAEDFGVEECCLLTADGKRAIVNDMVAMATGSIATFRVTVPALRDVYETVSSGIILSTTIGSTGISRSAGGAVLANGLEVMEITPILPNRGEARPLVVAIGGGATLSWNRPVDFKTDGELCVVETEKLVLSPFGRKLRLISF